MRSRSFLLLAGFLLGLAQLGPVSAGALPYAQQPPVFRHKWEALLHYADGRSSIHPGSSFFLAPDGYRSPENELSATEDFFRRAPENRCRYPARNYLLTGNFPSDACGEFNDFKSFVSADKVSLVFATESVNSPVSSMGHAFLMLEGKNARGLTKQHAAAFVADKADNGNLIWAFLRDSISGRYTLAPYSDSIYAYVSEEHRSLWEYELDLSEEERCWLFLHLFELKTHRIHYSFFTHNCATGLERLMTAASDGFRDPSDRFYETPAQYLHYIWSTGRVKAVTVRPSPEDSAAIAAKRPLDPLAFPDPAHVRLSGIYSSRHGGGVEAEFLTIGNDIYEDTASRDGLKSFRFLDFSARIYKHHAFLDRVTVFDIRSLPDVTLAPPLPNFGLDLRRAPDSGRTSLYPDLHAGAGVSVRTLGLRPFWSLDVGLRLVPHGPQAYVLQQAGIEYSAPGLGRLTAALAHTASRNGNAPGWRWQSELVYAKRLSDKFWLRAKYSGQSRHGKKNSRTGQLGFSYRF